MTMVEPLKQYDKIFFMYALDNNQQAQKVCIVLKSENVPKATRKILYRRKLPFKH